MEAEGSSRRLGSASPERCGMILEGTRMKGSRTVWRFTSPDYDLVCRISERSNRTTAVTVVENGRLMERTVLRGDGGRSLNQAWHEAAALYERYCQRSPALTRASRRGTVRRNAGLRRQLQPAIRHLEQIRGRLLHDLDSLDSRGHQVSNVVRRFRAAWEVLDLEHHFLTGRPLSAEQYRKQLRGGSCRHGPVFPSPNRQPS